MNAVVEVNSVSEVISSPKTLMVAFASSDGEMVNQHFGSSRGFYVFGIDKDVSALVASKSFIKEKQDGNEDKLKPKLSWLHGCDVVYVGSIGGSASKQLLALGVHPIVVKGGPDIEEVIEEIQQELSTELSPMLVRVMKQKTGKSASRFDEMDIEGWEE